MPSLEPSIRRAVMPPPSTASALGLLPLLLDSLLQLIQGATCTLKIHLDGYTSLRANQLCRCAPLKLIDNNLTPMEEGLLACRPPSSPERMFKMLDRRHIPVPDLP